MRQSKQLSRRSQPVPCCEPLEERLVFGINLPNGEFEISPPGGGQGYSDVITHPMTGVIGLRSAEANSNGVVNWELTTIHEWTPGDHAGPHRFAS